MVLRRLTSNRLFAFAAGLFFTYWAVGYVSDPYWFSSVASGYLLIMSLLVSYKVVPEAISIIRQGTIGPGAIAVIAMALIATGGLYTAFFNIAFYWYQWYFGARPESWIGAVSSYGRAQIGLGFLLLALAPETSHNAIKFPRWYFVLGFVLLIAGAAFVVGYTVRGQDESFYRGMHDFDFSQKPGKVR